MQGINKKVIEITETESELIERVIVFLRPGCDVRLQRNQDKARAYVSGLCCKRRKSIKWVVAAAACVTAATVAALIFLI